MHAYTGELQGHIDLHACICWSANTACITAWEINTSQPAKVGIMRCGLPEVAFT